MEPVTGTAALLSRVRTALRGHGGGRDRSAGIPAPAPPSAPSTEARRIALFRSRFEALGGMFLSGPSVEPLVHALGEALRIEGVRSLLCADGDPDARRAADALVPFGPFAFVDAAEVRRPLPPAAAPAGPGIPADRPSAPAVAGIQSAEFAVAETGTLVQTSAGGKTLLPGLVTEVHVALLTPAAIVDRMEECLSPLSADPPRNISFVTGPSRTADIELTLTIGVHGPRKVIAVLIV